MKDLEVYLEGQYHTHHKPEHKLMLALLIDSIRDLARGGIVKSSAYRWFRSKKKLLPVGRGIAYLDVLEHIDLDACVERGIRELLRGERTINMNVRR